MGHLAEEVLAAPLISAESERWQRSRSPLMGLPTWSR